jgi:hypothetical protein
MSLSRLNYLLMTDILPFNFGMTHQDWIYFYDNHTTTLPGLCPKEDPRTWPQEKIDLVNTIAQQELLLYARLMALPKEEFREEVGKIIEARPK